MTKFTNFVRPIALAATLAAAVTGIATPALAGGKTKTVTVPAAALPLPTSKLCMPGKNAEGKAATLCQTRDEWSAQGVTIVVK